MHVMAVLFCCCLLSGDAPRAVDNQEWIQRDLAVARHIVSCLPPDGVPTSAWLAKLAPSRDERFELGYGGRRHDLACYGGYTTTWITLVSFEDRIVSIDIKNPLEKDEVEPVGRVLTPVWSKYAQLSEGTLHYSYRDAVALADFRAAVSAALGAPAKVAVSDAYAGAYALLTEPASKLVFGDICYYGGTKPEGRAATDSLVAGEQVALLRNVLRSMNPVARVYAAAALLKLQANGTELVSTDADVIEKIRTSKILLQACFGSLLHEQTAAVLLTNKDDKAK
ncbi:MAG: hypothetical protein AAF581_05145 [Planctomycetota bacterium]